jgi:membrane-bound lytic murein transglycosylase D
MPATAKAFGMKTNPVDQRLDPEKNTRAAARYLRQLYRRFGSWPLALAAYNGGQGRVARLLRTHEGTTFNDIAAALPAETRMYVPRVMALIALRENTNPDLLPSAARNGVNSSVVSRLRATGPALETASRRGATPFSGSLRWKAPDR